MKYVKALAFTAALMMVGCLLILVACAVGSVVVADPRWFTPFIQWGTVSVFMVGGWTMLGASAFVRP